MFWKVDTSFSIVVFLFSFFSAGIFQVLMEEGNHFHLKLLLKAGGTKFCTYFSCWHINVSSGQWQFLVSVEAHNWSLLCFFLGAIIFFCFGNVTFSFASGDSIFSQRYAGLCVLRLCPKASSILIHSELCVVLGVPQWPKIKTMLKRTK